MPKKLPNIILIVLDTARAKSFSCYGYHRKTTPNIDRIAEESTLYKWCFAPANWTIPSHASLFTGLYPSEHGCHWRNLKLNPEIITLSEALSAAGMTTIGISCNPLISKDSGFARGFDHFIELFGTPGIFFKINSREFRDLSFRHRFLIITEVFKITKSLRHGVYKDATIYSESALEIASKYIKASENEPFFLFLNLMQTHSPYRPPRYSKGFFGSTISYEQATNLIEKQMRGLGGWGAPPNLFVPLVNLYDEEITFLDMLIGNFWAELSQSGLRDRTIIIITSDHGELLGEHNGLYDHTYSLYNELIRVPLIIYYPPAYHISPEINKNMVQTHDLFSTILEIIEVPLSIPKSSISLFNSTRHFSISEAVGMEVIFEKDRTKHKDKESNLLGFPYKGDEKCLIDANQMRKFYYDHSLKEIYDLESDPWELVNLVDQIE